MAAPEYTRLALQCIRNYLEKNPEIRPMFMGAMTGFFGGVGFDEWFRRQNRTDEQKVREEFENELKNRLEQLDKEITKQREVIQSLSDTLMKTVERKM